MPQLTIPQALDLALQHHQAERLGEAETIYRQILNGVPDSAEALHGLGLIAWQSNQKNVAVELIGRAVSLRPQWAEALNNLGVVLREVGRPHEAADAIRRAISLNPDLSGGRGNLALALNDLAHGLTKMGRLEEAACSCREAIMLSPDYAEAHVNLGISLNGMGRLDEAISAYRQAIALRPEMPEALNGLGNALLEKEEPEAAIAAFRAAIAARPEMHQAQNNLGNALKATGRVTEAIAAYRQAITLRPDLHEMQTNLGNALVEIGEIEDGISAYRSAIALDPSQASAGSNLLYAMHLIPDYDAQTIAQEHRDWGRRHGEHVRQAQGGPRGAFITPHVNVPHPDRRLRIGYLSADFKDHAASAFLLPLLAEHDRGQVEVFCYSATVRQDARTAQHRAHADQWREISGVDDEQAAQQIRLDQIDILVDLGGHTAGSRLLIFARKPAPVQVSWLAYPDTTGLSAIDYRLTDALADPPGTTESLHSEKLHRLPRTNWCWMEPQAAPAIEARPLRNPGCITFGSFNYFSKVTPTMLHSWGRILRQTPGSRLLLKATAFRSPEICHRVKETLSAEGIDESRVDLRPPAPGRMKHLAMYNEMDISLDTFPYHGTTTTCEALWMGVPVITLAGQTHVSRVGVSLLSSIGLSELIATTSDEYERLAVELANNPERLAALRAGMRQRMLASPLMDAPQFARDVEAAYRQMWGSWCEKNEKS